jgi:hypothetical protein
MFLADPATKAIIMIGEIGGQSEDRGGRFHQAQQGEKMVGFIAGEEAAPVGFIAGIVVSDGAALGQGERMGHAGAIHPGSGRRRGRDLPKGRQALAEEMKLALVEVYEVASFYAHFDIVLDGEVAPPALSVRVCDSLTCELYGAQKLLAELPAKLGAGIRVLRAPCMGGCHNAPVVAVGHALHEHATLDSVVVAAKAHAHPVIPPYPGFDAYRAQGGYKLLEEVRSGKRKLEDILKILDDANLRGLGGAGFPTGRKWRTVASYPGPRLMAVNADEGEPGTFKDRIYLENDPHRMLEGMLLGALAVEATEIYIYLRDEYPQCRIVLEKELAALVQAGLTKGLNIHLRRGAGAYICGEESSMLESIEGKRGLPRHKPPYPFQVGLFGLPTLINNIETLYWVRDS